LGQWGSQVAATVRQAGAVGAGTSTRVHLVDSSAPALELAQANAAAAGAEAVPVRMDIIEALGEWESGRRFDVVICDPPALIKSRKAHPEGSRAYQKVFRQALRRVSLGGGWFVACSCSHHFSEEEFDQALATAAVRENREVQWLARGGHAPDHPVRLEFREGQYLKCRIAWVAPV
ncbi:MAG TPA: methyltransferase domain-containing protein, partial [Bdellovibrionota bacterium]|nr:methyltransferase domain-containing protein [Bdellovibrionota bacterium]